MTDHSTLLVGLAIAQVILLGLFALAVREEFEFVKMYVRRAVQMLNAAEDEAKRTKIGNDADHPAFSPRGTSHESSTTSAPSSDGSFKPPVSLCSPSPTRADRG